MAATGAGVGYGIRTRRCEPTSLIAVDRAARDDGCFTKVIKFLASVRVRQREHRSIQNRKRAIYMNCDGLGTDWVQPTLVPTIAELAARGRRMTQYRAVFPSVTRVSAASVATGCRPARHGLQGNRMALVEDGRLKVHDVGPPGFFPHWRRLSGHTLQAPVLAERLPQGAGFVAFSNVSPGASYALDPDHHGFVYHRAGSFAPGGTAIVGDEHLAVSHDCAGDVAMTQRFCREVIAERKPAVSVLWLANPDLTLHGTRSDRRSILMR